MKTTLTTFLRRATRPPIQERREVSRREKKVVQVVSKRTYRQEHVEGDFANVISQYDYTYDAAGWCIEIARFEYTKGEMWSLLRKDK